jgi:hypothetical protein
MDTYLDELVIYEHGKYDLTKYKEWISEWDNWLKVEGNKEHGNKEHGNKEPDNNKSK